MSHERSISDERVDEMYRNASDFNRESMVVFHATTREVLALIERLRIAERALDLQVVAWIARGGTPQEQAEPLIAPLRTKAVQMATAMLIAEGSVRA